MNVAIFTVFHKALDERLIWAQFSSEEIARHFIPYAVNLRVPDKRLVTIDGQTEAVGTAISLWAGNDPNAAADWVKQLQARGLGDALGLALDVLEPLGVRGAQLIWVAQPVLGVWFNRDTVHNIAQTLETPGEVAHIRHFLEQ